jgi:hypothetical protein
MAFDRRGVQVLHLPVSPKPAIISIIVEDWTIIVRIVGDLILYCIGVSSVSLRVKLSESVLPWEACNTAAQAK